MLDAPGQVPTAGAFNLATPGGEWVWNEGTPADIPVVDGVRVVVLDPPPYKRGWVAVRFFPGMAGDLVLERVLGAGEAREWLGRCAPPKWAAYPEGLVWGAVQQPHIPAPGTGHAQDARHRKNCCDRTYGTGQPVPPPNPARDQGEP
ncbi:hypothetical protein [Streptomyces sp. NPDC001100]